LSGYLGATGVSLKGGARVRCKNFRHLFGRSPAPRPNVIEDPYQRVPVGDRGGDFVQTAAEVINTRQLMKRKHTADQIYPF
jgi:hypothetical protein